MQPNPHGGQGQMTQEDDRRDDSGTSPGAPDDPGSSRRWAAPGQGSPPVPHGHNPRRPRQPGPTAPGFAPPGGSSAFQPSPPGAHGGGPVPGYAPPPLRPGVVPLRPMTLGDILNGAFGLIRHNPRTTIGLSLIVMAITSILGSVGTSAFLTDYNTLIDQLLESPAAFDPEAPLPFR